MEDKTKGQSMGGSDELRKQDMKNKLRSDRNSSELAARILELLNKSGEKINVIREILLLIKKFTGFEAVGIRLKEEEDYPYYETNGFPQDFVEAERYLCARNQTGNVIRDSNGNIYLECMCGNIINKRVDSSLPFFTKAGSFWSNCTTELLASTSEKERQTRTRNRCNGEGYESVALIPLRSNSKTIGLLQFNDKRKEMFTLEMIEFFEKIGASIGIALARKQMEEALKKSHDELEIQVKERTASLQQEIAKHKKADEELVKLYAAIRQSSSAIVITDVSGNIEYVNPKFTKLTGYSSEEVMGKNPRILKSGETLPEEYKQLWGAITSYKEWRGEFHNKKKNGRLYWEDASISAVKNSEGVITNFIKVAEDITEHKKLEEHLLQSQKLDAVGTLAGGIAHDFNNLLTPIKGYAELSMTSIDKKNPIYDDLNEICLIADKAADLTQQLMLFSRKQPVRYITLNLNKIIEKMSKMLRRIIGENIEIKINLQPDIWNVNADESRIEQVVMNLTVNARDAMPKGGTITVKTENITLTEEYSKNIPLSYPGRFVKLSIQDNGIGMTNEVVQRIFEPFFTTKSVGKGTGLGLFVVYGIVKQYNGWINVYSEPDKGTIFKIYLPVSLEKKETIIQEKVKYDDVKGHGERILVVEDEKGIRDFINKALSMNGYVVFLAGNVKEAIEIYEKEKGKIHLIISDVVLPDKTGIELVNQFFIDNPKLKVIFSSGYLDDKSQWEMIQKKGYKFLQKPYELKELLSAIIDTLGKDKNLAEF